MQALYTQRKSSPKRLATKKSRGPCPCEFRFPTQLSKSSALPKKKVLRCFQWNQRRKPVACGAQPRSHPFLEDHGTWETGATTIGRAHPKIAGSRPGGVHARRRAWARLTRRQPPHARRVRSPRPTPAANGHSPIPLEIAKNRRHWGKSLDISALVSK